MNKLWSILIYMWMLAFLPCLAFSAQNSFVPPSGKTLLLVGQDQDTIAKYVKAMGNVPGGTMVYTDIQKADGLDEPADYGGGLSDGNALLKSYPNSVIQVGLYMVGALDSTLAGTYDANLKKIAQWIKKANRPVYLRIGYEFDLPGNHYDPKEYQQVFRYVVDSLRKEGVRNASYVWHTYCPSGSSQQWMDWYPGDDYVDWFGVSLFVTQNIPVASNFVKLAREHGKPFMICESTPMGMYTFRGKMDWYNHVFQFIKDQKVEIFCYINTNWDVQKMWLGQHWGDNRLQKYPEIKEFWLKEINQDRYLKASPGLFCQLGWVKTK